MTDTAGELADKTERLVDAANDAGGPDNITAVLVKYTSAEDDPDTSEMFSDKNTSEIDTAETGEMTITAQNNRSRGGRKNNAKSSGKTRRAAKDDKNTGAEDD